MNLETPMKIRMLQRKLYQKAKEEPSYRFYLLYDKMYREDLLAHAYALAKSNQGAPGVDGQSFWGIESQGLEEWLSGIREDLRAKTYQPQPVRRAMNGSEDCRSGHAASDQDVVEGSGRGAGRGRDTAGQRWEGKHLWNPAGRRYQSLARQPVHEPFSEVLADHRAE